MTRLRPRPAVPLLLALLAATACGGADGTPGAPAEAEGTFARIQREILTPQCAACHTNGAAGAPKTGDAAAWAPRIATGYEALLNSALKGKGAMAAQGGGEYSDFEIGRAVVHMVNASVGQFAEPTPPAANAAASAPAN